MDVLNETRARSAELADHLAAIMDAPLPPFDHRQAPLRLHLWKLEFFADFCDWIDESYRLRLSDALMAHWRRRLTGAEPGAWRLFFYEDLTPTLAVLPLGPAVPAFHGTPLRVSDPGDVMRAYLGRGWHMLGPPTVILPNRTHVLAEIAARQGSIGRDTAQALGLKPGSLRLLIEQDGLRDAVNQIRARHHLPLEQFREAKGLTALPYRLYEETIRRPA